MKTQRFYLNRPSVERIVAEQACLLDALRAFGRDIEEPADTCWACLAGKASLERAHVTPANNGGSNEPSNFLLLCRWCHFEHPDAWSIPAQLLWLVSHELNDDRIARKLRGVTRALRAGIIDEARAQDLIFSQNGET